MDNLTPPMASLPEAVFKGGALIQNRYLRSFEEGPGWSAYVEAKSDRERKDALIMQPPKFVFTKYGKESIEIDSLTYGDVKSLLGRLDSYIQLLTKAKSATPDFDKYLTAAGEIEEGVGLKSESPDREWYRIGEVLEKQEFAVVGHQYTCLRHIGSSVAGILKLCESILKV